MAGVKGKSGGKRKGAGRPKKNKPTPQAAPKKTKDREEVYNNALKAAQECINDYCKQAKIVLTTVQSEVAKGLCKAIAQRELIYFDWVELGRPSYGYGSRGEMKKHVLLQQYDDKSRTIIESAKELGFDLKIITEKLNEQSSEDDGMFD